MTYDRPRVDSQGWSSGDRPPAHRPRDVPSAAGPRSRRRPAGDGGLFGSRSSDPRVRIAGFALALAGILMVVCSFFTWASAEDSDLSVSVSGMGSVSFEASEARGQALGGSEQVAAELDERSKSPGIITALVGAVLVASAASLIVDRYPGLGATAGAVLALIAVFLSLEYLFAPGEAVLADTGNAGIGYAAPGLWLVTLGSFAALVASTCATYVSVRGRQRSVPEEVAPVPHPVRRPAGAAERPRSVVPNSARPNHGPRPESGYRARSGAPPGHLDRRPMTSPNHRPGPLPRRVPNDGQIPNPRPPVHPRPRANQPPPHGNQAIPTQRRRPDPRPGPDRGLPPRRNDGPPPPTPRPRYRPPAGPDDGPPERR